MTYKAPVMSRLCKVTLLRLPIGKAANVFDADVQQLGNLLVRHALVEQFSDKLLVGLCFAFVARLLPHARLANISQL